MTIAFDNVVDAIAARLLLDPPVCPLVDVDDPEPLPEDATTGVVVLLARAEPQQLGGIAGNPVDWLTQIRVRCMARVTSGSARAAANALAGATYARLAADPSLGIAGVYLGEPSLVWDAERTVRRYASCTLIYTVQHSTHSNTLE